jgi:hypothetical protein
MPTAMGFCFLVSEIVILMTLTDHGGDSRIAEMSAGIASLFLLFSSSRLSNKVSLIWQSRSQLKFIAIPKVILFDIKVSEL